MTAVCGHFYTCLWSFAFVCSLQADRSVQNAAARHVTGARCCDHITPTLRQLHWLPALLIKIAVVVFQCLTDQAPSYLADHCQSVSDFPSTPSPIIRFTDVCVVRPARNTIYTVIGVLLQPGRASGTHRRLNRDNATLLDSLNDLLLRVTGPRHSRLFSSVAPHRNSRAYLYLHKTAGIILRFKFRQIDHAYLTLDEEMHDLWPRS